MFFGGKKKTTNLGGKKKTEFTVRILGRNGKKKQEKSPLFHHQLLQNESKIEISPWKLVFLLITKMLTPSEEFSNSESSFPTGILSRPQDCHCMFFFFGEVFSLF